MSRSSHQPTYYIYMVNFNIFGINSQEIWLLSAASLAFMHCNQSTSCFKHSSKNACRSECLMTPGSWLTLRFVPYLTSSVKTSIVTNLHRKGKKNPDVPVILPSSFILGTRIIYDRKFLLDRRNSPMAQTPPCHLPNIPGVTSPGTMTEDSKVEVNNLNNHDGKPIIGKRTWVAAGRISAVTLP